MTDLCLDYECLSLTLFRTAASQMKNVGSRYFLRVVSSTTSKHWLVLWFVATKTHVKTWSPIC